MYTDSEIVASRPLCRMAEKVIKLLNDLGSTPEEVAVSLAYAGIKGTRFLPHDCPIAKYLSRECGVYIRVGALTVSNPFETLEMPDPVIEFIYQFDLGNRYPALAPKRCRRLKVWS